MISEDVKNALQKHVNPQKAKHSVKFFKAGKGEYAEGDRFLGVTVPNQRATAKKYRELSRKEVKKLIESPIHEHRLTGLLILVLQFQKAKSPGLQKEIVDFYLKNKKHVNNWDLVDSSAHKILGKYLLEQNDTSILNTLAHSKNLWDRRIAMIATYTFIQNHQFDKTIELAEILVHDKHDLIHKAVGWMLREIGKKDLNREEAFLDKYHQTMPRTMLRYAIEKFTPEKKKKYMAKAD